MRLTRRGQVLAWLAGVFVLALILSTLADAIVSPTGG